MIKGPKIHLKNNPLRIIVHFYITLPTTFPAAEGGTTSRLWGPNLAKTKILAKYNTVN
jgi:hypothetical protein